MKGNGMTHDDVPRQQPEKAYRNTDFLNSPDARVIRILAEYLEPLRRFRHHGIEHTIVFFGSARLRSPDAVQADMDKCQDNRQCRRGREIAKLERELAFARYYEDATELARLLLEWSRGLPPEAGRLAICTGGGGGIMEATSRGATAAGGPTIGLNISLPHEQEPNAYITEDMSFEFHYFFMRKFWFAYLARALVVFPGGFGTLDELFEMLTLLQTGKTHKRVPVVIYGTEYWDKVLNLDALAEYGMISPEDLDLIHHSDRPCDAFEYLVGEITSEIEARSGARRDVGET